MALAADDLLASGRAADALPILEQALTQAGDGHRLRPLLLLEIGRAQWELGRPEAAGRVLSTLTPFHQPVFGPLAQLLLGQVHAALGDWPEAAAAFDAVARTTPEGARTLLADPAATEVERRLAQRALLDYARQRAQAQYLAGCALEGLGRYAEAAARLTQAVGAGLPAEQAPEARLRAGRCLFLAGQLPEANAQLAGVAGDARLGDQALLWQGRVLLEQAERVPSTAANSRAEAARALERAAAKAASLPEADQRLDEILLEIATVRSLLGDHATAAATYARVRAQAPAELRRRAAAGRAVELGLAGRFEESDAACGDFLATWPRGEGTAQVMLRLAENAQSQAVLLTAASDSRAGDELARAAAAYRTFLAQFSEHPLTGTGRLGLGNILYLQRDFAAAAQALTAIPELDRTGPLAVANYLLADCLLQTLPPAADDALSINRRLAQLERAQKLLERFTVDSPSALQVPDAQLKLGQAYRFSAALVVNPEQNRSLLQQAAKALTPAAQRRSESPRFVAASIELARVLADLGDHQGALAQLTPFRAEPLASAPEAPEALLVLGQVQLRTGRAQLATSTLAAALERYGPALGRDPARAGLLADLRLHHALALRETGGQARPLLAEVAAGTTPVALEARRHLLRWDRDDVVRRLEQLWPRPADVPRAGAWLEAHAQALADLRRRARDFASASDRATAEHEVASNLAEAVATLRQVVRFDLLAREDETMAQSLARIEQRRQVEGRPGLPPPRPHRPAAAELTPGPDEKLLLELLQRLIEEHPQSPAARAELRAFVEFATGRQNWTAVRTALAAEIEGLGPGPERDALQVRLAACLAKLGLIDPIPGMLEAIIQKRDHPSRPAALIVMGEVYLRQADWATLTERMRRFLDNPQFTTLPGISDRGLALLAEGLAAQKRWAETQQALEALLERFPRSPQAPAALVRLAETVAQKGDGQATAAAWRRATQAGDPTVAARAFYELGGLARAQGQDQEAMTCFLTVLGSFDEPQLVAQSRLALADLHMSQGRRDEARQTLQRLLQEMPSGELAEVARNRLADQH
jgi:TolA-binding protein